MAIDSELLLWINRGWADPGLDFMFNWVSSRAGFALPLLLILLLVFWRRFRGDGLRLWLLMILGVILGDQLGNLLKEAFAMPRPCYELSGLLRPMASGMPHFCDAPTTGMPSNHTLNFFAVAIFVSYALRRWRLSLLLFAVACLVGLSRIYLGKHYPLQVAAGAGIGLGFGYLWAWSGLNGFAYGRRILAQTADSGRNAGAGWTDPLGILQPGRRSTELTWTEPGVWLPLLVFLILSAVVWLAGLNLPLFHWFNGLGVGGSAAFWANLTLLGDALVAFTLLSLFVRQRPDIVGALLLAAVFGTLWVHGLKPLVDNPRPLAVLGSEEVHVIGQALRHHSFPSGHTTTVFTLAGVVVLRGVRPGIALIFLVMALLAGLSRAVVGAHWPLDILAGMFGGWLSAVLGVWLAQRWRLQPGPGLRLLTYLFCVACAVSLLITRGLGYPQAIGLQMLIALGALFYLLSLIAELWPQLVGKLRG